MTFLLGFLLAVAESSLGLGAVLPGEAAITGLAATIDGAASTVTLILTVALGATLGDHVGYLLGRRSGPVLRESRLVTRLGVDRWDRAGQLVARRGIPAVLVSRLVPFVRTVMPAVAGAARLAYPSFLVASVLGALAWASIWVAAGATVAALLSGANILLLATVAAAGLLVVWLVTRIRRSGRVTSTAEAVPHPAGQGRSMESSARRH